MKQAILNLLPKKAYMTIKRWDYKRSCPKAFEKSQMMRSVETEDGYSYKPFDDNKAIFIHIPKCAGVSVNRTLFGNLAGGHMTLEEYLNVFEPEHIDAYFKFTIVRNPWDRLVSAYFFLKKGGFGDRDRDWFNEELSSFASFDDFVKRWVNEENIWKWHHFRPQYHYMLDKREKVPLDFIGFLENLDEDFAFISQRMGLTVALPKSNKSEHNNYQDYYSEESKEIVKSVYSRDIQMLGYNFDNSALSKQLANRQENCA
jgi:hypothetical protein